MMKRFVAIGFQHLLTDRYLRRHPELKGTPFVIASPQRGRMVIIATSVQAEKRGIETGMVVADARAAFPNLHVVEGVSLAPEQLLTAFAEWAIRFTPIVATVPPDGLLLDATGCTHLWQGERPYLKAISQKLTERGYHVRVAMAGTPGAAWAMVRYGSDPMPIVPPGYDKRAIASLPPAALRIPTETVEKLHKLGLSTIEKFIDMPRGALRRRFGQSLLDRIDQVIGCAAEPILPIIPLPPYHEHLPCLEPVRTASAIRIAIERLLETLCTRLAEENKGLQKAILKTFRTDGGRQETTIWTYHPSCNIPHLFKLFELKITSIKPGLGIELFILEAPVVVALSPEQKNLWNITGRQDRAAISELLDRLAARTSGVTISRYLPAAHHWPERSFQPARTFEEKPQTNGFTDRPRPIYLLPTPEAIEVTAPVPDYPPLVFRYKDTVHTISQSDGPERIEQEWWIADGKHRDYYVVEDENGARYWIFRLGHYEEGVSEWFLHGFFA